MYLLLLFLLFHYIQKKPFTRTCHNTMTWMELIQFNDTHSPHSGHSNLRHHIENGIPKFHISGGLEWKLKTSKIFRKKNSIHAVEMWNTHETHEHHYRAANAHTEAPTIFQSVIFSCQPMKSSSFGHMTAISVCDLLHVIHYQLRRTQERYNRKKFSWIE